MGGGALTAALAPLGVDRLTPGDGHQPRLGIVRHAARRPIRERGGKGVGQRVLGRGDVLRAMREEGDELAVAVPRDSCRCRAGWLVAVPRHRWRGYIAQTGRTSIEP